MARPDPKVLLAAIQNKIGKRACPLCGVSKWTLSDKFVVLSAQDEPEGVVVGGTTFPSVPLICTNCGNTHLINLVVLGLAK